LHRSINCKSSGLCFQIASACFDSICFFCLVNDLVIMTRCQWLPISFICFDHSAVNFKLSYDVFPEIVRSSKSSSASSLAKSCRHKYILLFLPWWLSLLHQPAQTLSWGDILSNISFEVSVGRQAGWDQIITFIQENSDSTTNSRSACFLPTGVFISSLNSLLHIFTPAAASVIAFFFKLPPASYSLYFLAGIVTYAAA